MSVRGEGRGGGGGAVLIKERRVDVGGAKGKREERIYMAHPRNKF